MRTFRRFFSKICLFFIFLNIQIDLITLETDVEQFTLTTKKSLHIIFNTATNLQIFITPVTAFGLSQSTRCRICYRPTVKTNECMNKALKTEDKNKYYMTTTTTTTTPISNNTISNQQHNKNFVRRVRSLLYPSQYTKK